MYKQRCAYLLLVLSVVFMPSASVDGQDQPTTTRWVSEVIGYGGRVIETLGEFATLREASARSARWHKEHPKQLNLTRERKIQVRVPRPLVDPAAPKQIDVDKSSKRPGAGGAALEGPSAARGDIVNSIKGGAGVKSPANPAGANDFATPFSPEVISLRRRAGENYQPRDYTNDPYVTLLRGRASTPRPSVSSAAPRASSRPSPSTVAPPSSSPRPQAPSTVRLGIEGVFRNQPWGEVLTIEAGGRFVLKQRSRTLRGEISASGGGSFELTVDGRRWTVKHQYDSIFVDSRQVRDFMQRYGGAWIWTK